MFMFNAKQFLNAQHRQKKLSTDDGRWRRLLSSDAAEEAIFLVMQRQRAPQKKLVVVYKSVKTQKRGAEKMARSMVTRKNSYLMPFYDLM
jgi:hypothetical protein